MNPIDKKIFVVGTGRCGTTWIGTWLRQHPLTFGGPETHIFRILKSLINPEWNQGLKTWIGRDVIVELFREFASQSLGACRFRQEGQNHLIEHSACHYEEIELVTEIFPDALFIHPYREVRNVVESQVRSGVDAKNALNQWIEIMTDMQETDNANIFHIKYESLVETPALSATITDFLGLDHHKDIDSWEFPVNTSNFYYNPDRWKNLPDEVIRMIDDSKEAQRIMKELKYASGD